MATSKQSSPVSRLVRESRALRGKAEAVLSAASEMLRTPDGDSPSAGAAIAGEAAEWESLLEKLRGLVPQLARAAGDVRTKAVDGYVDLLRQAIKSKGHEVFGESNLLIVDRVVHVDLDLKQARAHINGVPALDMARTAMVAAITDELARLRERGEAASTFLPRLLSAYELAIAKNRQQFGTQVMLTELLPFVALQRQSQKFLADPAAAAFEEYPVTLFRADLMGVLSAEAPRADGALFRWAPGSTTKGAVFMFVPSLGRATHVGRVWFARGEEQA